MPPPRVPAPPPLLMGAQQEQRSAITDDMELILTDLEEANQIALTAECLASHQRRKLLGTPTHTHIKLTKVGSNDTADLNGKRTEAGIKKSLEAQVVAQVVVGGGDATKAPYSPRLPQAAAADRPWY